MLHLKSWQSVSLLLLATLMATQCCLGQEKIEVDAQAQTTPFPHYWEQMFGSGRAILSLRESYRDDVGAVKQVADFRYVRFTQSFTMSWASITRTSMATRSTTFPTWIRSTMGC